MSLQDSNAESATICSMDVGIRELRADLSRYVKRVREGEEIVVTERGRAVARLVPLDGERKIDRLIREGSVIPAPTPWGKRTLPKPVEGIGSLSDVVLGDRR
jgi:prevent-host-death family protein